MDKRTLLATGLCMAIFLVWSLFVAPAIWPPPKPAPRTDVPVAPSPVQNPTPAPVEPSTAKPALEPALPEPPEERHSFTTSQFKVEFTSKGAGIDRVTLLYPDAQAKGVSLLTPRGQGRPHLAFQVAGGSDGIETRGWKVHEFMPGELIEYRTLLRNGVEISKRFMLDPEKRSLKLLVYLTNTGTTEQSVPLTIHAFNGFEHDSSYRYEQYLYAFASHGKDRQLWNLPAVGNGEEKMAKARRIEDEKERTEAIRSAEEYLSFKGPSKQWFGIMNRFFVAILSPEGSTRDLMQSYWFHAASKEATAADGGRANIDVSARTQDLKVGAQPVAMEFIVFFGPLVPDALEDEVSGASGLIDYGRGCGGGCAPLMFLGAPIVLVVNQVAPLILWILRGIGDLFGNYGVGIIFTTLFIRICMFPLNKKSQVTMNRMSQLGPKIQLLKDRYKDDNQKLQSETMRLWKDNNIKPMAGCLPMFLQLPIFMSMYSVFELSILLREAPFMLWIRDLSQPDYLLGPWKPVVINLWFTTFSIESFNLLPILMSITWFLQSYYAPKSPDPQMRAQQKMLMWMPIVFGFFCYNLASGLSLYMLLNSLLAMAEQKIIKKFYLPNPDAAPRT